MKMNDLRKQSAKELDDQLVELKREQFNLRMQKASSPLVQTHEIRRTRRDIARVGPPRQEK